ncbi:hypothetical protein [Kocuria sp. KH4]
MTAPGFDYRAADDEFDARWSRSPLGRPGPRGPGRFAPGYDLPGHRWSPYGRGGRRSGLRMLPFPSYSTRTRRGTNVSVGGCCLPIPIGCLTTTVLAGAAAVVVGRAARS